MLGSCSLLILAVTIASMILFPRLQRASAARPQLYVKNTGDKPILLRHLGVELTLNAGQSGALRYSVGDGLEIFPGGTVARGSKTITLRAALPHEWHDTTSPYVFAEVNGDDPAAIYFEYLEKQPASLH
jgi:hypothetical protein